MIKQSINHSINQIQPKMCELTSNQNRELNDLGFVNIKGRWMSSKMSYISREKAESNCNNKSGEKVARDLNGYFHVLSPEVRKPQLV